MPDKNTLPELPRQEHFTQSKDLSDYATTEVRSLEKSPFIGSYRAEKESRQIRNAALVAAGVVLLGIGSYFGKQRLDHTEQSTKYFMDDYRSNPAAMMTKDIKGADYFRAVNTIASNFGIMRDSVAYAIQQFNHIPVTIDHNASGKMILKVSLNKDQTIKVPVYIPNPE